ncbi:hypothetical protein CVT25_004502 [Psilocybe cyanescens]|uniref:Uncharacterized protein n=1 Tax=Psilocybe cyanescens TaxID=93625 RepID=A0A409XRT5_PSICY|nr:hypothetical protein CVT25_004502 [Psilocybe cyanescens]
MTEQKNNLVFRNFLTNDIDATKALAFSPDIVPHFGNQLTQSTLIDEYNQFISLPLVPNDINLIYLRAISASTVPPGAKAAVVLRAVPSELILWPQAWNKSKPVGPGPLVSGELSPNEVIALYNPFLFTPSPMGGFHYALIATQAPIPVDFQPGNVRLRDALPRPPSDVKNWREYINFINNDTSTAYYNVVVADPSAPIISVSTRLHVVDDGTSDINFNITVENSSMPDGTFVSLSSPSGKISMGKTPLVDGTDVGVHVSLPPGFDDTVTINVYPPYDVLIETFAWVSLQASVVVPESSQAGNVPITSVYLLGAQNIVFHDDATTNLRFASPAANKLRKLTESGIDVKPEQDTIAIANATSVSGAATGWWFRDELNDTNNYPRTESLYTSPDIQAVGGQPLSNVQSILGGSQAGTDYTSANNIGISQGAPNYIYVRGNCTLGDNYNVQIRLFCIPNNLLLYPTNYAQYSVTDVDEKGNPIVATRTITSTSANSFNVLDTAFDLLNPQPVPAGSDHYCLIAETRNPTSSNPDPDWPHEDTGAFSSSSGFNTWVGSTPTVSWRNIAYKPGGAQLICTCIVDIPANVYPSSAVWTLEVDADNAPVGSAWELTGSGPAIPGVQIGFEQTNITASNMVQGCHFTGLPSAGYQFTCVLQWFAQGKTPGDGMKFSFALHTSTPPSGSYFSAKASASARLPKEAVDWPFTVGIHHPGVATGREGKKNAKGYLGHRFREIGRNRWPNISNDKIGPTPVYSVGGDHWKFD